MIESILGLAMFLATLPNPPEGKPDPAPLLAYEQMQRAPVDLVGVLSDRNSEIYRACIAAHKAGHPVFCDE